MRKKIRRHTISVKNAINGLIWAYKTQPNYRVHIFLSVIAIIGGLFFNISTTEWIIIVFVISVGLVIETINTSIEATTDAITKEWKEEIKIAKDASAAAMLTYAIGALIISAIIFIPKML